MSFSGKVVLVTGAGMGIGAGAARVFAKAGASLALVDRDAAGLGAVAQQCAQHGHQPLLIQADLSNQKETSEIIPKVIEKFGRLDVLISNAGFTGSGTLLEGNMSEAFDSVMQVNVRAAIQLTELAVPYLIKTKGNIVITSSIGAYQIPVVPQMAAYCMSKATLNHFTRCAALELAPKGIRVNSVNPGPTRTRILHNAGFENADDMIETFKKTTALDRLSEPEEIGELMLFLASDKARGITGSNYVIDNGALLIH